ncbi:MAG: nitrilase-related carbon-nitrogen hydrolase, partial [Planctomycetota bacterium]
MKWYALQLNMVWQDKSANRNRIRQMLATNRPEPGSLVVLPEMFETGFSMDTSLTGQSPDHDGEAFLRMIAGEFDIAILGGLAAPARNKTSRNEAVAFAPDGTELVRYQKRRPFSVTREGDFYPAGGKPAVFEWQGVRIAPAICYDLRFPELFRDALALDAEAFVVIACWPHVRSEHWVRLLQARAIENLAAVIGVNRCG